MRSSEVKFSCDLCGRVTYTSKQAPDGWRMLKFWGEDDEPEPSDCCDSCSSALYLSLIHI